MQKKDISERREIEDVLHVFYSKAFADPLIGRFFTEVVPLNLETHIPQITDFWESILFNTQNYRKNVMQVHQHIHGLSPIQKQHLDRWVQLFTATIDDMFQGGKAELMKQRALSIATIMNIKLNHQ